MSRYVLSCNPCVSGLGVHNPSAALFDDGDVAYAIEEERFTREKQAFNTFPTRAIERCLDHADVRISDLDRIVVPWEPALLRRLFGYNLKQAVRGDSLQRKGEILQFALKRGLLDQFGYSMDIVEDHLAEIGTPLPPVETVEHHRSHAASAYYLSDLSDALVFTIDGRGEHDCTVVWRAADGTLERIRTYEFPNSLGFLYGMVAEFLGYRSFHDEGKLMGLAPYGDPNPSIARTLRDAVDVGVEYDVTDVTATGANRIADGVERLEALFDRPRKDDPTAFTDWEKDLAFETQRLLEEIVTDVVAAYCERYDVHEVGLAGGVILNCKLNKRVMELDAVDDLFIQPVAHDAGCVLGGGALGYRPDEVETMSTLYWGDEFESDEVVSMLETNKIDYSRPDDLVAEVADRLADGQLVGWFQGRLEMGPRALGNRSILADPRTAASRDRVNEFVKHREGWRPFAPVMLESAADTYLENATESPYMIRTFDVVDERADEIPAVLHPADDTTRPQTVRSEQNPRLHELLTAFERRTDVPVLLNTSFNDHGEPIVRTPREAVRDFYATGLDALVLEDVLVEK